MKIKVVSDLHLEFDTITINNNGADVLILSGDICLAADFGQGHFNELNDRAKRYVAFFEHVCKEFKDVIYVFGNHEHYHGDYATTTDILKNAFASCTNLHILDGNSVDIDGILFVGGTLWTDFDGGNPVVMWDAQRMMNDYRTVRNGENVFLPSDTIKYHEHMLKVIDEAHQSDYQKIVVCGHHAPSYSSISSRYVGDALNSAYASNLERFIEDRPKIKLWTHGHVHTTSNYMIQGTHVVCNPRGYANYEENITFDPKMIVEV